MIELRDDERYGFLLPPDQVKHLVYHMTRHMTHDMTYHMTHHMTCYMAHHMTHHMTHHMHSSVCIMYNNIQGKSMTLVLTLGI